jgi:hypothetical protein
MGHINKFMCLPSSDRRLLVTSVLLLWALRLGLWLLPFRTFRRLVSRLIHAGPKLRDENQDFIYRATWAVKVTSKLVLQATCLVQALATHILLSQKGCESRLRIGVAKDSRGKLEAHAWVESRCKVVIGESEDLSRFTLLPPVDLGKL